MEKSIYRVETCDYCDNENRILRPSPCMADSAIMCKWCWDSTKKEYAASHGENIPEFEDGPGWDLLTTELDLELHKIIRENQALMIEKLHNEKFELVALNRDLVNELEKTLVLATITNFLVVRAGHRPVWNIVDLNRITGILEKARAVLEDAS